MAELGRQVRGALALPDPVGGQLRIRDPHDVRQVGFSGVRPDDQVGCIGRAGGRIGQCHVNQLS